MADEKIFKEAGILAHAKALERVGITPDSLNEKAAEELKSESVHWIKVKGFLPDWIELPAGYTVISRTAEESIVEHRGPRWETQQKARMDLQKRLSLYPKEQLSVEHGLDSVFDELIDEIMGSRRGKLPIEE